MLVVDDDRDLADTYALWLSEYDVRVAYGGEDALDAADETVDVVLLDRRLPRLSGDEVLERLDRRDVDVSVAVLTAVEPGLDIVDLAIDDYLEKPVTKSDVRGTVDDLWRRTAYTAAVQEYFAATSKLAALRTTDSSHVLADDRFLELQQRVEELEERADGQLDEVDDAAAAFRELPSSRP